jgi:glutamyl-tRNA synthetase
VSAGLTIPRVTRLAPSPTGALHLGNARTFLATWAHARQRGWRIILRIEDIDGPRIKPGTTQQAMDDLAWLGIDWDDEPTVQSHSLTHYVDAADRLVKMGVAYPCVCTRKEVETASSAPHADDGSSVYPGTCRGRFGSLADAQAQTGRLPAVRFRVPDETFTFVDRFAGRQSFDLPNRIGDFVIAKPDRSPAYQLAVVVDDVLANVTDVIRGDDLLDSVPRQVLLYRALGHTDRVPDYYHLPLVVGTDGRRLAKRHGDTRLSSYRDAGVRADRMRAWLANSLGVDAGDTIRSAELVERFAFDRVPNHPIVFGAADDAWLRIA